MKRHIETIKTLCEALPYIKAFHGATIVIKYGGSAMTEPALKKGFARDMALLKYVGMNPVIVHGGGPQIGQHLKRLGKESRFIDGIRVTDDETMEVVEMVLVGKINKEIVGLINHFGGRAVGICGKDGGLIRARRMRGKKAALGHVGEIDCINARIIESLDEANFIPVIAPVGGGEDGESYNINADTVAGALAVALKAEKLMLLTDVEGVKDRDGGLITALTIKEARSLIRRKIAVGGMKPKLECAIEAVTGGVRKAHIVDGRVEHSVLLEIFTDSGVGTLIS